MATRFRLVHGEPPLCQINTDYRMYGDQVSLVGQSDGRTVTVTNPNQPTVLSVLDTSYIFQVHDLNLLISQIPANIFNLSVSPDPPGQSPELNVVEQFQNMVTAAAVQWVHTFTPFL